MIERNASDGILAKINKFYDDRSERDSKGNSETFGPNDEKRRKMTINIPNPTRSSYTAREYLDSNGNVTATELTSQFMRFLYMCPETFFEEQFSDYYEGMIQCLKKQK